MTALVVTYRARPESADENQAMVEAVFAQLDEVAPMGIRYACLRFEDDTFVHIAEVTAADNPLVSLDSVCELHQRSRRTVRVGPRAQRPPSPPRGELREHRLTVVHPTEPIQVGGAPAPLIRLRGGDCRSE